MSRDNIEKVAMEAAKLLFDNPEWTYKKSIEKAKELIEDAEKVCKMEKAN